MAYDGKIYVMVCDSSCDRIIQDLKGSGTFKMHRIHVFEKFSLQNNRLIYQSRKANTLGISDMYIFLKPARTKIFVMKVFPAPKLKFKIGYIY